MLKVHRHLKGITEGSMIHALKKIVTATRSQYFSAKPTLR
jgi:hypothetical protein